MEIREATPADAEDWIRLRHELWPDEPIHDLAPQVREFFEKGTPMIATAFLAWDEGKAIGFLEMSVREYVPGADSYSGPFVEGWLVIERFRGTGVGRMLMDAAADWSRRNGYRQLGSDALVENTDSAAVHEALGFRTVEIIRSFIKDLDAAT